MMPRSRWGGGYCLSAACALYKHRDVSLLARDHEPTTEILGEVKRQNPPCAHWAGDLVHGKLWEFQKTSFREKAEFRNTTGQLQNTTVKYQNISCKIQLFSFKIQPFSFKLIRCPAIVGKVHYNLRL